MAKLVGALAAAAMSLGGLSGMATATPCYLLGTNDGYFRLAVRNPTPLVTDAEIARGAAKTLAYEASGFFNSILGFQVADGSVLVTPGVGASMGLTGHGTGFGILDVSCQSSQASAQPKSWTCRLTIVSSTQGISLQESTLTKVNPAITPASRVPTTP
jgi:hypothetical protein